jgi:hypothetical protein
MEKEEDQVLCRPIQWLMAVAALDLQGWNWGAKIDGSDTRC